MRHPFRPLLAIACACLLVTPTRAQQPLGQLGRSLPSTVDRALQVPAQAVQGLRDAVDPVAGEVLEPLLDRARESRRLLRRFPGLLDTDPVGELVMKQRLLALAPSSDALARIAGAGFVVEEKRPPDELGLELVVLRAPAALDTRAALALLRQLDPTGSYEFDHVYLRSGGEMQSGSPPASAASHDAREVRVGLVDGGVDAVHPALAKADVHAWGCNGKRAPDAHGTAVASLLMGGVNAQAGGGTLYAADIWCGQPVGGATSVLVEALAWMAREKVPVINVSLVGPDNAVLRRATEALNQRGFVLVAAVGNDGPAAPPLYPAAYPGVIGVTAVDRRGRVLPEAARGQQVDFAAPGSGLRAARPHGAWTTVRGTSFAAPLVAHRAALQVDAPRAGNADTVLRALALAARKTGSAARDDTYGLGILEN